MLKFEEKSVAKRLKFFMFFLQKSIIQGRLFHKNWGVASAQNFWEKLSSLINALLRTYYIPQKNANEIILSSKTLADCKRHRDQGGLFPTQTLRAKFCTYRAGSLSILQSLRPRQRFKQNLIWILTFTDFRRLAFNYHCYLDVLNAVFINVLVSVVAFLRKT